MDIQKKNLWCPSCKSYPDKVSEIFYEAHQERVWNGEEYELQDIDFGAMFDSRCGECHEILKDKPQALTPEETEDPDLNEQNIEGAPDV